MKIGDTVWIHPHGSPHQAVEAAIDHLSENQRSIALWLREKPIWCRVADGFFIHQEHAHIAMVLYREKLGPWIEFVHQGHYEIEARKPE